MKKARSKTMDEDAVIETDVELTTRIACGEEDAIRDFLRCHGGPIKKFLERRYPQLADDAFQLMTLKLVNAAAQFDPEKGSLRSWCIKVAQTCAIDLHRASPPTPKGLLHEDVGHDYRHGVPDRVADRDDPEAEGRRQRRRQMLLEAIDTLSPTEQKVIKADLAHMGDGTAEGEVAPADAVAGQIGTTIGAVRTARSRGRSKLREVLIRRGLYQEKGQP